MRNCLLVVLLMGTCWACKDKKPDFSGETPISISDLLTAFPKISLPYQVADTNITKVADTITLGYKALTQYFPDSAIQKITGKAKTVKIHPVGIIEKTKEDYLLINFLVNRQTRLAVFVTDKKHKYLASRELLKSGEMDDYIHSVSINKEPTFLVSKEKIGEDNLLHFTRNGWVYTSNGEFMIVVNDTNEDPLKTSIINPIDTLPRKNKYSGDYVQNDRNFVSIRDTKNPNVYAFFIHFEKNNHTCIGELKGECKMKSANTAVFSENGDPCVIDIKFEGNEVYLKEQGSCGSHRGIQCYFDDSFRKKKEPKTVNKK